MNILEMRGIEKSFSQVTVLKGVDFSVEKGEVRALVGANGAGKSTLMKILSGVYFPNKGEIFLRNEKVRFQSPGEAIRSGISVIYQELSLVPTIPVYENVYLNREHVKFGILDKKRMRSDFEYLAKDLNFDIPPKVKTSDLNIANRQMIEIMKAISIDADIIVMDEPTTALSDTEKEKLFATIRDLKSRGKTIIYISHILREIFQVSDKITVMRNGEIIGNYPVAGITQMEVAGLVMDEKTASLGEKNNADKNSRDLSAAPVVLQTENLTKAGALSNITLTLKKGEILGLAGLLGAGRTELCRAIFGDLKIDSGKIMLNGRKCRFKVPGHAVKAGVCLLPEDRKNHGLILKHPIYQNATIVCLKKMSSFGVVSKKKQFSYTNDQVEKLKIKIADIKNKALTLSGGNQQKVVVSKWFGSDFLVYLFDEPTKGIDVGAKEDVFKLIESVAESGAGVIFISSDIEEVLRVSDRILVMSKGRIVKELERKDFDLQKIMAYSMDVSEMGDYHAG